MEQISSLKDIPNIKSIEPIFVDSSLEKLLDPEQLTRARNREKKNNFYRVKYISENKRIVVGYIAEPKEGKNLPCIIWNRGGTGEFGAITSKSLFLGIPGQMAERGFLCIGSQYSGNEGGDGTDEHGGMDIQDVIALYPILQKYEKADAERIGMFGASRGGMMTYMLLRKVNWIKAAVIISAMTNAKRMLDFRPRMKEMYEKLFGCTENELKRRSVVEWFKELSVKTPLLIMHGELDERVPVEDAKEIGKLLGTTQIPHKLIIYQGEDHYLSNVKLERNKQYMDWFDDFLKKNKDSYSKKDEYESQKFTN